VKIAGVILAAGESRRMGFPKALLRYREETFLDTLVGLFSARCSPVIVVVGAHAERIRERAARPAEFVYNPDFPRGMTTSLQCGLHSVPADADAVLLTLVDHPAVRPETLDALTLDTPIAPTRPMLRVPRYGGRRGHPICFGRGLIPEFFAIPDGGAARDVVRAHAAQTEFLDLDDPGIVADIDDAEAYVKLTGASL
jgi:CTP:molybdopterin cytidylyltransferase MocA